MGTLRFRKEERLNKKKVIDELFAKGSSKLLFPLKMIFLQHPDPSQEINQVLISVPAKTFKRAVDRNTLKRRIREGYRLNKALISAPPTFCLAYIYIAKEVLPSAAIHQAVRSSFDVLNAYEKKV